MSIKRIALFAALSLSVQLANAQYNDSGISAGFFDASEGSTIDFSKFHLPPLAVLLENAKSNPEILSLAKAQEIAQAEVAKQKRHIFSYVRGHASYGYGKTDMWGNNSSNLSSNMIYQFQGSEQSYWNVGVNLAVPLEDILDLKASVKKKDIAYDQLKLQIVTLYVKITNDLVALKTASENAAVYQGAGQLTQEQFHNGEMSIADFALTKARENGAVNAYQQLQTSITTDIVTLEILTHTPIITNTTTDITLDDTIVKSDKQIAKENKAIQKQIKKEAEEEEKKYQEMEKADKKAQEKAKKEAEKEAKKAAKQKK